MFVVEVRQVRMTETCRHSYLPCLVGGALHLGSSITTSPTVSYRNNIAYFSFLFVGRKQRKIMGKY